jgi:serine protease AprX
MRIGATTALMAVLGIGPAALPAPAATATTNATVTVIVRGEPGRGPDVRTAVEAVGGRVTRPLAILDGAAAVVPAGEVATLRANPAVAAVTSDARGHMLAVDPVLGYDRADTGSLNAVSTIVGARSVWSKGFTGKGIDVALIDTGVSPVAGLHTGNVVNGPDLSFDSQTAAARYYDGYGHGTHLAGIIAGRESVSTPAGYAASTGFTGIAPDARLINVKVGSADGSADVSQVIAAIDWVTAHAHDSGLNIRVLNLSYGTDSAQAYGTDPLSYAVEAAWRKGILVIAAGGNDGTSNQQLADPAMDPLIVAVGAEDPNGTAATGDDTIPAFSDRGTATRGVDVVAPGVHVIGLNVPGSAVSSAMPSVKVGTRFVRGSGTSQATAVTSGVAALLLSARPDLTPDQAKMLLKYAARPLSKGTTKNSGAGLLSASASLAATNALSSAQIAGAVPKPVYGTGTGLLESARGTQRVTHGGVTLTGERDIFARAWSGKTWAPTALTTTAWQGGTWNANLWAGTTWSSFVTPSGATGTGWATATWTPKAWSGESWSATSWQPGAWDGRSWVGRSWVGRSWVSAGWSGAGWN